MGIVLLAEDSIFKMNWMNRIQLIIYTGGDTSKGSDKLGTQHKY